MTQSMGLWDTGQRIDKLSIFLAWVSQQTISILCFSCLHNWWGHVLANTQIPQYIQMCLVFPESCVWVWAMRAAEWSYGWCGEPLVILLRSKRRHIIGRNLEGTLIVHSMRDTELYFFPTWSPKCIWKKFMGYFRESLKKHKKLFTSRFFIGELQATINN